MLCPSCSVDVPAGHAFCGTCGGLVDPVSVRTRTTLHSEASVTHPSDREGEARFLPGATLAGRYRIVGLLGRGGMGEVYRADDLKLGQPVALKFLPAEIAGDRERLSRLLGEVRIARQVSHPSVCRVYDVGEADGHHFLSMEYVDGEDLASLLRRIGRLPNDKALEIARQLCAGLAAAHDQGILHRDLKPANVMIDGRGRARLTDFGLAGLATTRPGSDLRAGTPSYMAPEQLEGKEVSIRSDIYSLGLVLYELFTGKRAFRADTLAELQRLQLESTPPSPSSFVLNFDPAVEVVLNRCLDRNPVLRPASALAVAAALPGGDPLAAALAAGETPSPEMIAAAGPEGGLRPGAAVAWLSAIVVCLLAAGLVGDRLLALARLPFHRSFAALQENARQIASRLGYDEPDAYHAGWLGANFPEYFHQVAEVGPRGVAEVLEYPGQFVLSVHYRQALEPLTPRALHGMVSRDDPPPGPGDLRVVVDLKGSLIYLRAQPSPTDDAGPSARPPDWAALFDAAGLKLDAFDPVAPSIVPPVYADIRAAWTGVLPDHGDRPVRIEAAALGGRPVYFEKVISSDPYWSSDEETGVGIAKRLLGVVLGFIGAVLLAITSGGLFLAVRNLRMGRGDRRGAMRVAIVVCALRMIDWIIGGDHFGHPREVQSLLLAVAGALTLGAVVWVVYVAFEPYVRRLWPDAVVSWSRLLAGRVRDPLVGRDLLIGCSMSALAALALSAILWVGVAGGVMAPFPFTDLYVLRGGRVAVGQLFAIVLSNFAAALGFTMLFLLLRMLLRRTWIAAAVFSVVWAVNGGVQIGSFTTGWGVWLGLGVSGLIGAILSFVLTRFGLVALVAFFVTNGLLQASPFTLDAARPYFGIGLSITLIVLALAAFGFKTALAGRPLLGDAILGS